MNDLLRAMRRHRGWTLAATVCSVLNKVFDLAPPLLIGAAVDIVVRKRGSILARWGWEDPRDQLVALAVITFVVWALESIFQYAAAVLWRNLAQRVQHELRLEAYTHVQRLDMAWFEDRSTGGLMSVLNDDVNQLERFLDVGANEVVQVLTTVVVIGAVFFAISPAVGWIAMIPMPFVLWGSLRWTARMAPRYADVRGQVGELNRMLANNLGGIATIQSFTAEEREIARVDAQSERYLESNRRAIRVSSAFTPLIRMVILCGFTATLLLGGFQALDGRIEAGAYSVLVFLTQRLLWPLTRMGETFDLYQRAMASTRRILGLLETPPSIRNGPRRLERGATRGGIRFEQVGFRYGNGVRVLEGLDLPFEAGRTTAVVGPTGAGKSTVIKLLLRFYDPTAGAVKLDGSDLREIDLADLRGEIGFVSQDVFLFHGTVYENIAYGRPGASREEVAAAARTAEAHAFIGELPQGYDTVVGERGQKLSGGQRQRISIARAVLKDPRILVLDEATSSVDNDTEAAIQRALVPISEGRTVILIAHRLSTVVHADTIHVLHRGRLRESGTHRELLERDDLYASLWKVQTGFREEAPRPSGERVG